MTSIMNKSLLREDYFREFKQFVFTCVCDKNVENSSDFGQWVEFVFKKSTSCWMKSTLNNIISCEKLATVISGLKKGNTKGRLTKSHVTLFRFKTTVTSFLHLIGHLPNYPFVVLLVVDYFLLTSSESIYVWRFNFEKR